MGRRLDRAGRTGSLKLWGPSGAAPEMGTKYAVEHFLKAYNWDAQTRNFKLSPAPGKIDVVEFDYKGENQVVYQENGVTIRSWPATHAGDCAVSFSLEYASNMPAVRNAVGEMRMHGDDLSVRVTWEAGDGERYP